MTAMINGYPKESELHDRIERQLAWRGATDTVALIWHGYLSGLLEWGLIEIDVFDRLCALLPNVGCKELVELSMDEPMTPELEREINESMRKGRQ
ncbi:hypothetical protein Bsp3421_003067 [Burkholderia sp. FERM BP-3421]|jgi:hypothetical protein|uniref:hypothetical protein n=1 Tax=Burkholderia sp. FERM BP-3421 TaxID=1494466 RepID=UPI00235E444A|nr:hypothetical protein [Burkholderia sp. FERM BP-3421]WDD93022.1 hypothetical protein Bsp3421_003067 [Burkholderia sp. FERM BP-3421]